MTEELTTNAGAAGSGTQGDGVAANAGAGTGDNAGEFDPHGEAFKALSPSWQRELERLHRENKSKGDKLREKEDAIRSIEEKRLADNQEWQKLAETRAARLAELEPLQERFTTLEETTKATNAKRVAAIPENMRSLVPPSMSPLELRDWLDLNAAIFAAPRAPQMNGGALGDGTLTVKPKLTAEQQAMARKFGVTEDDFLKSMTAKSTPDKDK